MRTGKTSGRRRAHHNFHQSADDPVQRLLIAFQPRTYVPVHRHVQQWKWEMLLLIQGNVDCILYDDRGCILKRYKMTNDNNSQGIEIPANTWHSVVCNKADSVIFELKQGPYDASNAAEFSAWAPAEGEEGVDSFLAWQQSAQVGDSYSGSN